MGARRAERRRSPRREIRGELTGEITGREGARVIDLSLTGAHVEHSGMARPNMTYLLRLPLLDRELTLRCRVMWSRLRRRPGKAGVYYESGLEFQDVTAEAEDSLRQFLEADQPR